MLKKIFLLLCFAGLLFKKADASHVMGGEITWDCLGGGQYVFSVKLYRDCNGADPPAGIILDVQNYSPVTSVPLGLVLQKDISPVCNISGPAISCLAASSQPGWPSSSTPIAGAVQEILYQSAPITLTGVPPADGWIFTYMGCCRNGAVSNLVSPSTRGYTMRAVMYSYNGQNENPCFDSSPKFLEIPATIICVGTAVSFNYNAYDPDLDSLHYSWAQPLDTDTGSFDAVPIPFASGYSYNSPLPGIVQDPSNIPATLNSASGEITMTSYTQGSFITVVKVESWKCRKLVSEIFREVQIILLPCSANNAPVVSYTTYQDTVEAGELISFILNANDGGFLPDGITPQTVTLTATGSQFGTGYTSATSGCIKPPCATLSPPPPSSAPVNASMTFNWQTTCEHVLNNSTCSRESNTYTFVFTAKDDFCPVPAQQISTVSITVLAPSVVASPSLRCISVSASGDAALTWVIPADTGVSFNSYEIYSSGSLTGPYTLIDSVLFAGQTTYTHIGANAHLAPVYYFVRTKSACGILSPALDTLRSIHLNVTNPGNGTAVLGWNSIASPALSSTSANYKIFEEFPSGTWALTGTTTGLTLIDSIFICSADINYRVEIADVSGCSSRSSIDGGTFQNTIVPAIPTIDTVSVDDNNNVLINWNVSPSTDLEGYVIYKFSSGIWLSIDTVFGLSNISFTNYSSSSATESEQYRLTAYDSCENVSPLGNVYKTIYLTGSAEICTRSAVLNWTAYDRIGTGLAGYYIYQSASGPAGPYTLAATSGPSALTDTISGLAANQMYCFKIVAFDSSGTTTASSNRFLFYSAAPIPPLFSYLRKVSVVDPNMVDITCYVDTAASTQSYKILRSPDTATVNYVQIASVPAGVSSTISHRDVNVQTDKYSYYYKVVNVDSCGFDGIVTNIGRTILTTVMGRSDYTNSITWNDYEDWLGNVMSYNIYRGVDGTFDPLPIANIPYTGAGTNTFSDDIYTNLQGHGIFSYYVEAVEGMGNMYGFSENSISNIAEAYQEPQVFVPNAFKPSGINSVFKPVTTYVNISDYELMIFNRWSDKIFSTTDQEQGWDGTHNGKKSEIGVYVYLLKFKTSRGEYIEQKGVVTLIR